MSLLQDLSLSVIIPAFNEERRLPGTIRSINGYLTEEGADFEILVVDDGSQDQTAAVVRELANEFSALKLVQLERNCGKGRAVKEGILRARGDFILFTDADLSTPMNHLPDLLATIREQSCHIAIASRTVKGAKLIRRQVWYREAMGKLFGHLMRALLIRGVRDSQCGFKCFTREAARTTFSKLTCQNALFDMEILVIAGRHGYRIAEVPVAWSHDPDSRLVYNLRGSLSLLHEFLRIRRHWQVGFPVKLDVFTSDLQAAQTSYQEQDYLAREFDQYAMTKYKIILRWLAQHRCSRVLNVGCGSGELNVLLAQNGYAVDSIDPSAAAVALAERRRAQDGTHNVSIQQADLFEFSQGATYDAILCLDVLEHIEDDVGAVRRLKDLLAPAGILLISVPALQSLYGYHDQQLGHYRRYSKAQLLKTLDGCFIVDQSRYFGFSCIPLAVLYSRLLRKSYPVRKSQHFLAEFILKWESRLRLPLGTSLLVQARKAR